MPLTPEQQQELRAHLERRRAAVAQEVREDLARVRGETFGEHAGPAPDSGDVSVATLMQDLDQADARRDLAELAEIEAALGRVADGRYGTCAECSGDIEYRRLQAYPAASRCLPCQARFEKTHATAGHPTL